MLVGSDFLYYQLGAGRQIDVSAKTSLSFLYFLRI